MDREAGIVDEIEQYLEAAYEDSRFKVVVASTVAEIVGKAIADAVDAMLQEHVRAIEAEMRNALGLE